ncbi:MAG: iron ABC transporter permease [Prochloraceae cyanobacterium]|nr:iron ABC transporter permease [Prochloraceae cyanobacterium]
MIKGNKKYLIILLSLGLIAIFLLNLTLGSVAIPLTDVIKILLGGEPEKIAWTKIIIDFRLPKAITATLAGSALAVSGLQMQTLFSNSLAGPFVLGINSGASLGVALVVLMTDSLLGNFGFWANISSVFAASLGAAIVLLLVLLVARYVSDRTTLLVLGLMFGYGTSSIVSILLYFSAAEQMRSYLIWTMGSFSGVTNTQLPIFTAQIILGISLAVASIKSLNALLLGETQAKSLGINLRLARFGIIISTAFLAGGVTAFCGPIAFLGVAVPHLARNLFKTANHRSLLPTVAILGAILALFANLVAQLPGSQLILPLNSVTALLGSPIVIWVILRRRLVN